MATIRPPAVAGQFYPDDKDELEEQLRYFLQEAFADPDAQAAQQVPPPKAIVAPHAGYVYSGPVAASAYIRLLSGKGLIKRVVLLGPCHRVPVKGLALCSADYYQTPLGRITLDKEHAVTLQALPQVRTFDECHIPEHSLEVHLPFLQGMLGDFSLLPLVVGKASPEEVAEVLDAIWGGPETLIVVSTDLSHYLDYEACQALDSMTARAIESFDLDRIGDDQACGRVPLKGLLMTARRRGMKITTLDVRNSGDTSGPKGRVVGYGSWILQEPTRTGENTKQILSDHGRELLNLAARSIRAGIAGDAAPKAMLKELPQGLVEERACFVTLHKDGKLRGCIGSLQAWQPLAQDVLDNARKAAFEDPRFAGLTTDELSSLELHISVLSPATPMTIQDEADLLDQLRPGVDGLIIQDQNRRAVFLPTVWDSLPDKKDFLAQLKRKAGMAPDHWSHSFKASRFTTEGISSEELDDPTTLWQ